MDLSITSRDSTETVKGRAEFTVTIPHSFTGPVESLLGGRTSPSSLKMFRPKLPLFDFLGRISMTPTTSFGKRGLARQSGAAVPAFSGAAVVAPGPERTLDAEEENAFVARLPILTVGIIALLMFIFGLEKKLAFDIDANGDLSHLSLLALGAAGFDLVVGAKEFWRLALAPLLHASTWHFVGNSFALFFVGLRLEPLVGRRWFAAIFVLSAAGGIIGSLIGNPHALVTVGASGAITGLIGALFVVSFNHRADEDDSRAMRTTALKFGIPALAPLMFGASGNTDYFAHFGGAVAGATIAWVIALTWAEDRMRPNFGTVATGITFAGLALATIGSLFAAHGFADYRAKAAELIPSIERPKDFRASDSRAADLLARYPRDPLAHIIRAVAYDAHRASYAAELELRRALDLTRPGSESGMIHELSRALLAMVIAEQGRIAEAKGMVADVCAGRGQTSTLAMLRKAKLCA